MRVANLLNNARKTRSFRVLRLIYSRRGGISARNAAYNNNGTFFSKETFRNGFTFRRPIPRRYDTAPLRYCAVNSVIPRGKKKTRI